jgi:hypothetical protein
MAYPSISAPYGLKPVNLIGGRVYSGSTRMIPITEAYGYNFFNGDVVKLAGGTLAPTGMGGSASVDAGTIGVFVGAEYSTSGGPIYGKNRWQYWAANTVAQDAIGYVVDDPQACFRVAVLQQAQGSAATFGNTPGSTIGYMSPAFVGTNAVLVTNGSNGGSASGNTSTGDSAMGITGTNPTAGANAGNLRYATATPFRVIQLIPDTAVAVQTTLSNSPSSGATFTVSSATGIQPGMQVICTSSGASGMLPGDFCTVVGVSGTTITVQSKTSATNGAYTTGSVTATSGNSVTFVGYPEVVVTWNFGYHSYMYATGV